MLIISDSMLIISKENYITHIKFPVIYFVVYHTRILSKTPPPCPLPWTYSFFLSFGVQYSDLQGSLASTEGFHGEAGRCSDLVALGLQTRSVGADTVWVEAWSDGSPGLQFGLGELRQVGHHGQLVHLGIGDFLGLNELLQTKTYQIRNQKHKPKVMHSLARTRRCTAKPINLLWFHLSWPYLILLICKEPQLTYASKDTTINFIYLLSFHLNWPYFDFTSKIFKKNKSCMFHTQPKYTTTCNTDICCCPV